MFSVASLLKFRKRKIRLSWCLLEHAAKELNEISDQLSKKKLDISERAEDYIKTVKGRASLGEFIILFLQWFAWLLSMNSSSYVYVYTSLYRFWVLFHKLLSEISDYRLNCCYYLWINVDWSFSVQEIYMYIFFWSFKSMLLGLFKRRFKKVYRRQ